MAMHKCKVNNMQNTHHAFFAMKIAQLAITLMKYHAISVKNLDEFLKMVHAMHNALKEV